jgi:hypothetical protein
MADERTWGVIDNCSTYVREGIIGIYKNWYNNSLHNIEKMAAVWQNKNYN